MAPALEADLDANIIASLRKEKGVELLDTIDKLRSLGIDSDIPLPQIVVVGEQSSGKSSVLEAISGITFPTNDGLCTRFPLEVVLRRGPKESIAVHIGHNSFGFATDERRRVDAFHAKIKDMAPLTLNQIPQIVLLASEALGVGQGQAITKHVVRVEVTGPKQDHLTLIDLPGLFYVTKNEKDSASPRMTKELADSYMKQPRTIILAVVSAKSDYATQEILETLKKADPDGLRTIGVITGLDTVESGSARERDYMSLALNQEMPLVRGWHVLRNPSFKERQDPDFNRSSNETRFFTETEPWNSLPQDARGAENLKAKLSQHLMDLIGSQMKNVIDALNAKIAECDATLTKLGPERSAMHDKRVYLSGISTRHRDIVRAALNGPYDDAIFAEPKVRLRAQISARCDEFASKMSQKGHKWDIIDDSKSNRTRIWDDLSKQCAAGFRPIFFDDREPRKISISAYLEYIDAVHLQSRARELPGLFDPLLVGKLFRDQSENWKQFAEDFINDIDSVVTIFMQSVTQYLADERRARVLFAHHVKPALKARKEALQLRLTELLKPYTRFHPITYDSRLERLTQSYENKIQNAGNANPAVAETKPEVEDAVLNHPAAYKLMNHMKAYYNIAKHAFVDNVIVLGIECCLLDDLDKLLSPEAIIALKDEEVERLASDSAEDAQLRRLTKSKVEKLTTGRAICMQYENSWGPEDDSPGSQKQPATDQMSTSKPQVSGSIPVSQSPRPVTPSPSPAPQVTGLTFGSKPVSSLTNGFGSGLTPSPASNGSIFGLDAYKSNGVGLSAAAAAPRPTATFGSANSAFGSGNSSFFGVPPKTPDPPTGAFGSGSGLFGRSKTPDPPTGAFGSSGGGFSFAKPPSTKPNPPCEPPSHQSFIPSSVDTPFVPLTEKDGNTTNLFQSIVAMPQYSRWSFEELRLADEAEQDQAKQDQAKQDRAKQNKMAEMVKEVEALLSKMKT